MQNTGVYTVVGKFGSGDNVLNDNSLRMLSLGASAGLTVMGSWFQRREIHRWSWYEWWKNQKGDWSHSCGSKEPGVGDNLQNLLWIWSPSKYQSPPSSSNCQAASTVLKASQPRPQTYCCWPSALDIDLVFSSLQSWCQKWISHP